MYDDEDDGLLIDEDALSSKLEHSSGKEYVLGIRKKPKYDKDLEELRMEHRFD